MKEITITKENFMKAIAETMDCKLVDELISNQPMLTLVFVAFGNELQKVLFKEEEEGVKHE